jgi:hypothetical protein
VVHWIRLASIHAENAEADAEVLGRTS